MRKFILVMMVVGPLMSNAWADKPPVNNVVPPCDNSPNSKKPSCNMDSDSVNVPPKMPHERGVIVPPEVPAEGLPNREKQPVKDSVQDLPSSHDNHLKN